MPTMASITVKKDDGTTNIVFDAIAASAGDGSPAVWRQDTGNTAALPNGLRASMEISSKWNGPKTARQVRFNIAFPYAIQDSTTTLYSAKDRVVYSGIITVPQGIPQSAVAEAASQGLNLLHDALVYAVVKAGYAPT